MSLNLWADNVSFVRSPWADFTHCSTLCFTPIAHTAAYTRQHRILLGTCYQTRQEVLKAMPILNLYRVNPKDGKVSEYRIPFDLDKTGLCVTGWMGLGITFEGMGRARGLSFAKDLKRLAFVVRPSDMAVKYIWQMTWQPSAQQARDDAYRFALLFPNATHIAAVYTSSLTIERINWTIPFLSLFSFRPFEQKTMVEGFLLLKSRKERCEALDRALRSALERWDKRIWDAVAARLITPPGQLGIIIDPWQIGDSRQKHQQA